MLDVHNGIGSKKDMKYSTPIITSMEWAYIIEPWDFYEVKYVLNHWARHTVYIPSRVKLVDMTVPEMVVLLLRADLQCTPEQVKVQKKPMKKP